MLALLIALAVLFALSAFFSASETVLFSLSPLQLRRISAKRPAVGSRISGWLADPSRILSTILAGNTLVNFAIATCGYLVFFRVAPHYAETASVVVFTLLLLLFGEIVPKQFAMRNAELLAPAVTRTLEFWYVALWPASRVMALSSRVFKDLLQRERRALSDDELRAVVESVAASGGIDEEEASMVKGVLRLSGLHASDEMTPRVDMIAVEESESDGAKVRKALAAPYPFIPVYRKTPDAIVGFIDVKRLALDPAHNPRNAMDDALFVPENVELDDLLVTFQRERRRIAVVLDEYGGTAGIITRGDILELIADPVDDSGAPKAEPIVPDGPGAWICDGTVSLEELNNELGLELSDEDADRLAGWILAYAGRLPHTGETVTAQGVSATVTARRNRRILKVRLVRLEAPDREEEGLEAEEEAMEFDDAEEDAE